MPEFVGRGNFDTGKQERQGKRMSKNAPTWRQRQSGISLVATSVVCGLLVLAGAAALWVIYGTEPTVSRESAVRETLMPVDAITVTRGSFRPEILATGSVIPSREITLRPRIDGEVIHVADAFVPGGFVRQGDELLRIDGSDYRITLAQRESELQRALAELEIEHGRQDIALRDYRGLGKELDPENRSLVLREPQLKSAEAGVRAATAAVEQAQLDLARTNVTAPFDAQVLTRAINLGSQVAAGDGLARLVGVDTYWVETTVPLDRLRWLTLPDHDGEPGALVTIRHRTAWPEDQAREGRLYRLIGELEGETRMARLLISIDDPLGRLPENAGAPELIIGSFVQCRIRGRELEGVVRVDRDHVRKGDTVWLAKDGQLAIRPVNVVFRDAEYAYIDSGLNDGDQLITTSLATVKEGIRLRVRNQDA
jgi:RND family efflux transporter MFP subunit